jgi:hypothetical protein
VRAGVRGGDEGGGRGWRGGSEREGEEGRGTRDEGRGTRDEGRGTRGGSAHRMACVCREGAARAVCPLQGGPAVKRRL